MGGRPLLHGTHGRDRGTGRLSASGSGHRRSRRRREVPLRLVPGHGRRDPGRGRPGPGRRAGPGRGALGRTAPGAGRAARRGQRTVRGIECGRRRNRAQPRTDARGRDRPGLPGRGRRAGCVQRRGQGGCRRARTVVPARPVVVRDLLHRRQRGHQRRGAVLREVRRDHRLRPRPRHRACRRDAGDAGRKADQGRGRAQPGQAVRRQRRHARDRDPGHPAAGAGPGRQIDARGGVPDGRRCRPRRRRRTTQPAPVDDGADGPGLDQCGRGLQADGPGPARGCVAGGAVGRTRGVARARRSRR